MNWSNPISVVFANGEQATRSFSPRQDLPRANLAAIADSSCTVAFILLLICRFNLRSAKQMAFAAISRSNDEKLLFPRSGLEATFSFL